MKKLLQTNNLPWVTLGAGIVGAVLRTLLFSLGLDLQGLLTRHFLPHTLLWLLTFGVCAYLLVFTRDLKEAPKYSFNFPPSMTAAAGTAVAAAGILVTGILDFSTADALAAAGTVLSFLSVAALLFISHARWKGLHPSVLFFMVVCLYLMVSLVSVYRLKSSDPQIQTYCFPLLASGCIMLAVYYDAAFAANAGDRRLHTLFHLAAGFFCLLSLPRCDQPVFYLTMAVWMFSDLCNLTPMPRAVPETR